jgi:hypothetical protein
MSYSNSSTGKYSNALVTVDAGMSADELSQFGYGNNPFENNNLLPNNGLLYNLFWKSAYYHIYMANAAIEGLQASGSLPTAFKNQLLGESKFLRAYIYFYLTNLYGDVPLATTTSWNINSFLPRSSIDSVYRQIKADLKDAQKLLATDYSVSQGERTRANIWAATALLSRVYLYREQWDSAEAQATSVISNGSLFELDTLNGIFLKTSPEAILQFQNINQSYLHYAVLEANIFIPVDSSSTNYTLTPQLLDAFEPADGRRTAWVDSTSFNGEVLYYPYKYKIRETTSDNITEYYTILRLAEQYLIRAEARAEQKNLTGAIDDLNMLRIRANLSPLLPSLNQSQVLAAVAQERRIELFAELGHRWFDIKRTKTADQILGPIKNLWKSTAQLYPIPAVEIQADPNLKQNPGYY